MSRAIVVSRAVTGLLFLSQLVLGIAFWTGHAQSLVQLHMTLGGLFVLSLWALAALCARAGAPRAAALLTTFMGAIVTWFGLVQMQIVPGANHWMIRLVHLLLGLVAMASGGSLASQVPRSTRTSGRTVAEGPARA
jgi:hypothetical protein